MQPTEGKSFSHSWKDDENAGRIHVATPDAAWGMDASDHCHLGL